MIRVMVVDNEPLARAGIVMLVNVEEDIAVVAEAVNGQDAFTQVSYYDGRDRPPSARAQADVALLEKIRAIRHTPYPGVPMDRRMRTPS